MLLRGIDIANALPPHSKYNAPPGFRLGAKYQLILVSHFFGNLLVTDQFSKPSQSRGWGFTLKINSKRNRHLRRREMSLSVPSPGPSPSPGTVPFALPLAFQEFFGQSWQTFPKKSLHMSAPQKKLPPQNLTPTKVPLKGWCLEKIKIFPEIF